MNSQNDMTFWERTGQKWKIDLILLLLVLWGSLFILDIVGFSIAAEPVQEDLLLFLAITSGLILFFLLRCPECRTNLGFKIVRKEPINNFWQGIVNHSKCPNCEEIRNRRKVTESQQNDAG